MNNFILWAHHVYFTSSKATGATNDILVGLFCIDFQETMSVG